MESRIDDTSLDKGKGRADLAERAEQGLEKPEKKELAVETEDELVIELRAALWCNMAAAEIQCVGLH